MTRRRSVPRRPGGVAESATERAPASPGRSVTGRDVGRMLLVAASVAAGALEAFEDAGESGDIVAAGRRAYARGRRRLNKIQEADDNTSRRSHSRSGQKPEAKG